MCIAILPGLPVMVRLCTRLYIPAEHLLSTSKYILVVNIFLMELKVFFLDLHLKNRIQSIPEQINVPAQISLFCNQLSFSPP